VLIPTNPVLDREVQALHYLARQGLIPADVAERQINTYLPVVAGAVLTRQPKTLAWMRLPLTDAPHYTMLPDLGYIIHCALSRNVLPNSLFVIVAQSIPFLRHNPQPPSYTDSQDVAINLAMALLLGLYPGGTVKRPGFVRRAGMYASIHALLTAQRETQTAFCRRNHSLLLLACMEYVTRIIPAYMPAQAVFLMEKDPATSTYFRRIPTLCDELRQLLEEEEVFTWPRAADLSNSIVEKVSRLKKCNSQMQYKEPHLDRTQVESTLSLTDHWDAPFLHENSRPDEFRILSQALGLCDTILHYIQTIVQIYPLPANFRQLQLDRLAETSPGMASSTFLKTRYIICTRCVLSCKGTQPVRLRLDTLRQNLVCSTCMRSELVSIDTIGRVLRHKSQYFVFCPSCTKVQPYNGIEQFWVHGMQCSHAAAKREPTATKTRPTCSICTEPAAPQLHERVDHLTGRMVQFYFCQRHTPRQDALEKCVNARQLGMLCP
jgi:hypothetical protein